jgi:hypothetical protein
MRPDKPQDARRVAFENPIPARIMAIDGTWRRACIIKNVSDVKATPSIEDSIQGPPLNEFFLLLSSTGLAYRRCQLERVNGTEIAVIFLRKDRP